uniref:Uncharacterized protein n=1 Tax=Romanomermis culicivorax TaxID=13658 RepID=A0A915IGH4_ROMCU
MARNVGWHGPRAEKGAARPATRSHRATHNQLARAPLGPCGRSRRRRLRPTCCAARNVDTQLGGKTSLTINVVINSANGILDDQRRQRQAGVGRKTSTGSVVVAMVVVVVVVGVSNVVTVSFAAEWCRRWTENVDVDWVGGGRHGGRNCCRIILKFDGNLLFMGLRNNEILCSDLRLYHHRTVFTINQFSTCFLGIMRDENYLMSANFQGKVKLWDLRQKRVVQEFSGLKNSYTKTPVIFNEEETVAFA